MYNKVYVVGAGASGLLAAIKCSMNGADVTILESQNKIGKKILITGNGRCNISNEKMDNSFYLSLEDHNELTHQFVKNSIKKFKNEDLLHFFKEIGMSVCNLDGYFYPYTLQAQTVTSVLLRALQQLNIKLELNSKVKRIESNQNSYRIFTDLSF